MPPVVDAPGFSGFSNASAHSKPTGPSPALDVSKGLEVAQAKAGDNVPGHTPVAAAKAAANPAVAATPQVADAGAAKNVGNAAGVPAAPDHGADPDALLAAIALGAIGSSAAKAVGDGSTGGAVAKTAMVNPAGERPAADGEPNKATVQNSQSAKAAGAHHNPGKGTGNPGAGNGNANSGGNGKQTAANFGGEQTTQAGPSTNANTNAGQIAMDPAFKATLLNTTSHGATQAAVAGSMTEQIAGAPADPTATSSTNNGTTVAQMTKVAAPKLPVLPQLTGAANQVAMQLTQAVSDGATKFTMRLHPAQLGRVDVSLEISADGRVTAVVSADRQETLDLLRNDSSVRGRGGGQLFGQGHRSHWF